MYNINPIISFVVKYRWNEIPPEFELIPRGLFDPLWCSKIKWIVAIRIMIMGVIKCMIKNLLSVGLDTAIIRIVFLLLLFQSRLVR